MNTSFAMKKLVLAALIQGASATVLTAESFDAEALHPTRSAFVLFYAPWCGHCKAMKPAWNEFSKLHAKSTELLVGEVDCTAAGGEELCERFEVEGFPTLKFFEAGSSEAEEFDGDEMSVEGFQAYSRALLGPACSPSALGACSAEDRKVVESYRALSAEARVAEQDRLAAPLAAAKAEVKRLEKEMEALEEAEEAAGERLEELKKSSKRALKLMGRVDAADAAAKQEL